MPDEDKKKPYCRFTDKNPKFQFSKADKALIDKYSLDSVVTTCKMKRDLSLIDLSDSESNHGDKTN